MGNQQSSEKSSSSRSSTPADQKKVNRRQSAQGLHVQHGRGTPAGPAATPTTALAQTTSNHLDTPHLQSYLPSSSPDSARAQKVGRSGSRRERKDADPILEQPEPPAAAPQPATPMNVPVARPKQEEIGNKTLGSRYNDFEKDYGPSRYIPPSDHRPPRLPLPIAPESPHLGPVDTGNSNDVPVIFETDEPLSNQPPHLRRKSSMMSTPSDDEDAGDELPPVDPASSAVSTVIEWNQPAHKVYVTGTFANWDKKYRMHHKKHGYGMYCTINLPPGTHHLMFLVDDVMTTNPDLPTAVDFNNVLVNYVEIAQEDVNKPRRESNQNTVDPSKPAVVYPAAHTPQPAPVPEAEEEDEPDDQLSDVEPEPEELPAGDFRQITPQALIDMDLPEDDPRYQTATRVVADSLNPPSLPLFLTKSLLNGNAQVKDDHSVLTLPNHTVLNHLMTSSVKNGVLATSVTTRYKKKYVSTISFKPVPKTKGAGL